jgi:hypothetical protein
MRNDDIAWMIPPHGDANARDARSARPSKDIIRPAFESLYPKRSTLQRRGAASVSSRHGASGIRPSTSTGRHIKERAMQSACSVHSIKH